MNEERRSARYRLMAPEAAFTLVELLVVLAIVAALLAVAIGSFVGARQSARQTTAAANVWSIAAPITSYYVDHGTYATMTLAALRADYDASIDASLYSFGSAGNLTDSTYCVQSTSGSTTYMKAGPGADIVPGTCP
jgi:prepilin-type N-terminal cleavage/methylation domain-containing protein